MGVEPKEVDVFRKYSKNNKLLIVLIAILIASVIVTAIYFFAKSLFKYTVTFELNGGYVYGVEDPTIELGFLQKIYTPKAKKEGFYLESWYKDEGLTDTFKEGSRIWRDTTLYAKWEEGFAIRLNYAEGEENADLPIKDLKGLYEDYVKQGSTWSLPKVYNTNKNSVHYGEQLLWYDNPECTGDPFESGTYEVTENKDIYGKWFDTKEEKFDIDENGTLNSYNGFSRHIILPSSVKSIRSIEYETFRQGFTDQQWGREYHSVFQNVLGDDEGKNSLRIIYLNKELESIGECAFRSCESLQKVVFLGENTTIGDYAFDTCTSLKEINLPTTLTKIPKGCFKGAFNPVDRISFHFGNNITRIEDDAFLNSNLYSITLDNVSFIGQSAFSSCHYLTDVNLKYNQVITTNCVSSDVTTGVFFDTYTSHEPSQHLKIIVPTALVSVYKTTYPWSLYSTTIVDN